MSTCAVTYEQVTAVANALFAAGNRDPGAKAVRHELAAKRGPGAPVGSLGTIQRHLVHWRGYDRPLDPATTIPQLPAAVAEALAVWVSKSVGEMRVRLQHEVDRTQAELMDAAEEGAAFETLVDQLKQTIAVRTTERDRVSGELGIRASEVAELRSELAAAKGRAALLEGRVTTADGAEKAAIGRIAEIRAASEIRTGELQVELELLRGALAAATQERNDAREARSASDARVAGESRRADQAEARETALQAEVTGLRARGERLVSELDAIREREYDGKVQITELLAQLQKMELSPAASSRIEADRELASDKASAVATA
jgi:chromosome segregation ATPase